MLLELASITDSVVTLATHVIRDLGLAGVALLMLTSGVVGLPGSEPTLLFAGFNVFQHHLTLVGIIVFGLLGDLLGAVIAYSIGYYGRRELLERHGSKLHLSQQRLDRAHGWFERYGAPVILVSRVVPLARLAFPYAAGVAEMPFARFFALLALGSTVWVVALALLGRAVGSSWPSWRHHLEIVDYAVIGIVLVGIVYLVIRRLRRPGDPPPAPSAVDVVSE